MKKAILLIVTLFYANLLFAQNDPDAITKIGDRLPQFTFEIEKGKTANISDYKGKLILINLFATWCPPCNVELPEVQKEIWEKYKDNKQPRGKPRGIKCQTNLIVLNVPFYSLLICLDLQCILL